MSKINIKNTENNFESSYDNSQPFYGYIPSPPDERDYTIETVHMAAVPIPEEYRAEGMPVLNQKYTASCVAHAIAVAMGYGEIRGGNPPHDFSRNFIYSNREESDYHGSGMILREALKNLNHYGDCEYVDFPGNEEYWKCRSLLEKDLEGYRAKAAPYKVLNYFRCYTDDEIKLALLNQGAVVMGTTIYKSFAGECPLPQEGDEARGGHAMCIVGWDKTGWIIQNSWGKTWGKKGFLHMPYKYPIREVWGITVNEDVPAPTIKENIFQKIWKLLVKLFEKIKDAFKKN